MAEFVLAYGNTLPVLERALFGPAGAFDATGYTITLRVWLAGGTALTRTATVVTASPAVVRYAWQSSDWGTGKLVVGLHRMRFHASAAGGLEIDFPNDGFDSLEITPAIPS